MTKPLKSRLYAIIELIRPQIKNFQQASEKLAQHDKILFAKIFEAARMDGTVRAQILADELTTIRQREKIILRSEIVMKAILAKIRNISEPDYGQTNDVLMTAVRILQIIGCQLEKIFPKMAHDASIVREKISVLVVDVGIAINVTAFEGMNKKAIEMMAEIYKTADQKMLYELPSLPDLNPISP